MARSVVPLGDGGALQPFDVSVSLHDIGTRWKRWVRNFTFFVEGRGVTDVNQKRALLLGSAGPAVQDIFETLPEVQQPTDGDGNATEPILTAYDKTIMALDNYFTPKTNIPYERTVFRRAAMLENESISAYVTRLKHLAKSCDFGDDTDNQIRDQVMEKVRSAKLRKKFLDMTNYTLDNMLAIARAEEATEHQASDLGGHSRTPVSVNRVQRARAHPNNRQEQSPTHSKDTGTAKSVCFRCKSPHHLASDKRCPARGRTCKICGRKGHYAGAKFCSSTTNPAATTRSITNHSAPTRRFKKKPSSTNAIESGGQYHEEDYSSDSADYLFAVNEENSNTTIATADASNDQVNFTRSSMTLVSLNGHAEKVLIDSGAAGNVMDKRTANRVKASGHCGSKVVPTSKKLTAFGSNKPLDLLGEMHVTISANSKTLKTLFYVYNGSSTTLLGRDTAIQLGLLRLGPSDAEVNTCGSDSHDGTSAQAFQRKYPQCFNGVGKLKDFNVSLHINPNVDPVAQSVRRIPFGLRDLAKAKLDELEAQDIIERVEGPTPWVSPLVVIPKDHPVTDVRLCVDMREANKAIVRERHPIPTVKELLYNLNGAKVFSKVDLRLGFHQCELDEKSRSITTFVTPWGLRKYKRLMFGVSSAPEVYQHAIQKALAGLEGCQNYADDIVIYGASKAEHDRRLDAFFHRASQLGLTLNAKKCQFGVPSIDYVGYKISGSGVTADPRKVTAIKQARPPKDISE